MGWWFRTTGTLVRIQPRAPTIVVTVAQQVERLAVDQEVMSSNLIGHPIIIIAVMSAKSRKERIMDAMEYHRLAGQPSGTRVNMATQTATSMNNSSGADEVLEMARAIAGQAEAVLKDVNARLSRVTHPAPQDTSAPSESLNSVAPLFGDLRCSLVDIRASLYGISSVLGRLDL